MYHYNLNITIFSENTELIDTIKSIKPLDNFSHTIRSCKTFNKEDLSKSDIIIIDLPFCNTDLNDINKETKVIVCTNCYVESLNSCARFFLKPFDYDYVKYSFKSLLKEIKLEEDLRFNQLCLNTVVNGTPDMIWFKTLDGIHTLLNDSFCKIVGKEKATIINKDHYEIWDVSRDDPNSGADICKQTEDAVLDAGHTLSFNESVKSCDEMRQLITYKTPLYDKNNKAVGTVGFGHDVTNLNNIVAENEILLNSVPYAVLILDDKDVIRSVNKYFEKFFNIEEDKIIGTSYFKWVDETFVLKLGANKEGLLEGIAIDKNGEEKRYELTVSNIIDKSKGKICIFKDVTVIRRLEEQIIENSNVDFMTKLYNRRYLDQYISDKEEGTPLSLFSIDLDKFKDVNDTYGHKAGDNAIILTSEIIKSFFNSDLTVRMGGDEFLVVKEGNSKIDDIKEEAQRFIDILNTKFKEYPEFVNLSASIGIAQGILDENGIDTLLYQSDGALYEAKNNGRNCYSIYEAKKYTLEIKQEVEHNGIRR